MLNRIVVGGGNRHLTRRGALCWALVLLAIFAQVVLSGVYLERYKLWAIPPTLGKEVTLLIAQNQSQNSTSIPWLVEGNVTSKNSTATCDFLTKYQSTMNHLRGIVTENRLKELTADCLDLIVYSVAFDNQTLQQFYTAVMKRQPYSKQQLEAHGRCFVLFTLQKLVDEMPTINISAPAALMGQYWVIPVSSLALPYANSLQNRYFIKYLGGTLFPQYTSTVVWQEASAFFTEKYMYNAPNNYLDLIPGEKFAAACLTGISMPAIERNSTRTLYLEECQTIQSLEHRQKCQSYIQQLNHSHLLDQAMIATSFLVWTNSHIDCQRFNADLQCTILEELHTITNMKIDDTVLLSDAIFKHNVHAYHKGHPIKDSSRINKQINNLELYRLDESNDHRGPMVRVIRSNCHWNRGVLDQNCKYWPEIKRRSEPDISSETLANQMVDFHTCTSPESDVPFPMKGDVSSIFNANHTCGLNAPNPICMYLKDTIRDKFMPQLLQNCSDLVVFGVALGHRYVHRLQRSLQQKNFERSNRLLEAHGKCFFLFVSQEDMPQSQDRPLLEGHFWFVPIPRSVFPYRNPRRNAKLLKYMGQLLFPDVPTVIWQDAKLVTDFKRQQATNYKTLIRRSDTCVTTFGLPVHANTLGASNPAVLSGKTRPPDKFQAHCDTIVRAVRQRPNVTDSIDSVTQQCLAYVQHAAEEIAMESLHENLVDTAFIIWNQGSNECRNFGHQFRCSPLDQIHCHSDRDQIPFPFVVQQLGLEGYYKSGGKRGLILVDDDWNPRKDDLDMKSKPRYGNSTESSNRPTLLRILRSNCHWYTSAIGRGCRYW
ncbi:DUF616 domain containing protein [Nitzschia inconspicua]|uniref:DUF616 domain containing protein n=1 Tax=Nitzschia inconspicua TaxID=303405 RepID=A0A9K3M4S7_9STRA|nr:DUF616 domain containing protein [Nitzschia inconspicua]